MNERNIGGHESSDKQHAEKIATYNKNDADETLDRGSGSIGKVGVSLSNQLLDEFSKLHRKLERMEDHIDHLIEVDKVSSTTERWRAWQVR